LYPSSISVVRASKGLTSAAHLEAAEAIYSANDFDITVPTSLELFRQQLTAPLFVFQVWD
jgi:hypothetical protein